MANITQVNARTFIHVLKSHHHHSPLTNKLLLLALSLKFNKLSLRPASTLLLQDPNSVPTSIQKFGELFTDWDFRCCTPAPQGPPSIPILLSTGRTSLEVPTFLSRVPVEEGVDDKHNQHGYVGHQVVEYQVMPLLNGRVTLKPTQERVTYNIAQQHGLTV